MSTNMIFNKKRTELKSQEHNRQVQCLSVKDFVFRPLHPLQNMMNSFWFPPDILQNQRQKKRVSSSRHPSKSDAKCPVRFGNLSQSEQNTHFSPGILENVAGVPAWTAQNQNDI